MVHVSTSEVYGDAQSWPITERAAASTRSPYAPSKVGADALIDSFRLSFELPA